MIARLKKLLAIQLFGIAMFTAGGLYVAVLITVPKIAYMVLGR